MFCADILVTVTDNISMGVCTAALALGCWRGSGADELRPSLAQRDRRVEKMGFRGGARKKGGREALRSGFTLATPTPTKISMIFGTDLVVSLVIFSVIPWVALRCVSVLSNPHQATQYTGIIIRQ